MRVSGFTNRLAMLLGRPYVHRQDMRFDEVVATQRAILDQLQAIGHALARLEERLERDDEE